MRTTPSSSARRLAVAVTASLGLMIGSLLAASPASASTVDPSTLTPAPPEIFNPQCRTAGQQILCDVSFVDPYQPVNEPTDIFCDSPQGRFEVLDTSTRTVVGTRYYTADGLLARRHFRDEWTGAFSNSLTGKSVPYAQHDTFLHDLRVLGDPTTGLERQTTHFRLITPRGAVVLDAGRAIVSDDLEHTVFRAGKHTFDEFFEDGDANAIAPICAALS